MKRAALLLFFLAVPLFAQQKATTTQNPLDKLHDQAKAVFERAGVPFSEEQEKSVALMIEDRRQASEELFGQLMDFRGGPVQGQQQDRAVAAIKWMHDETLDQLDLTMSDWHVLNSLRWAGEPYRRKAGELARRADLTSGAMTSRLDALEKEGLVRRLRDPDDRRSVLVELTSKGRQKHEQGLGIQGAKEALLAEALTAREKEQLNGLLRRVMITLEGRYPGKHD